MTIWLKPVARDDLRALFKLKVAPDQESYVAPNAISLAELHFEPGAEPFAIMDSDRPVGFLQVIDMRLNPYLDEGDDPNGAYLWRLMVAHGEQRKGYGRTAMRQLFDWARWRGLPQMVTSTMPENQPALDFYLGLGFTPTGRITGGEIELARALN